MKTPNSPQKKLWFLLGLGLLTQQGFKMLDGLLQMGRLRHRASWRWMIYFAIQANLPLRCDIRTLYKTTTVFQLESRGHRKTRGRRSKERVLRSSFLFLLPSSFCFLLFVRRGAPSHAYNAQRIQSLFWGRWYMRSTCGLASSQSPRNPVAAIGGDWERTFF